MPGGCTKYIQAPDVSWNKPFKPSWLSIVGIHEETASGNLKTPPRRAILQWILDSWAELHVDVIKKSFTTCALNLPVDGSRDDNIYRLKKGQPCSSGKSMLKSQLGILSEPETNPFECTDSDVEDACPTLPLLDSDHEEDSDVEIEV